MSAGSHDSLSAASISIPSTSARFVGSTGTAKSAAKPFHKAGRPRTAAGQDDPRRGVSEATLPEEVLLGIPQFTEESVAGLPAGRRRLRRDSPGSLHRLPTEGIIADVDDPPVSREHRRRLACADVQNKRGFRKVRLLYQARGKGDGIDVDHRRLPDILGQERRPFSDERAGGDRGEDLRFSRPAGQRVIDEDLVEGVWIKGSTANGRV